ncbi:MAG: GerMN domain-containing protein [Ilumatobacter sp.]|jgi:hypothetical protein|uniref:GerMN domain-containing protein n=1 Tax=Ilumatobacter sp. TaxID=1967498 RepID=UPI00391CFB35
MKRLLAILTVALAALAGCSIREDTVPRDIPSDRVGGFGDIATGDAAVGASRIFLLTPPGADDQRQLRAVPRTVTGGPEALLRSLFAGPNPTEIQASLSTAIPPELQLDSARAVGRVLTIDIDDGLAELSDSGVRSALAQIVATATQLDGVERVRIRVFGENQAWPTGNGRLVDEPLSIYDYPGLLESSQPAFTALPPT